MILSIISFRNSFAQTYAVNEKCNIYSLIIKHLHKDSTELKKYFGIDSIRIKSNSKVILSAYSPIFLKKEYLLEILKKNDFTADLQDKKVITLIDSLQKASAQAKTIQVDCLRTRDDLNNLQVSFFKDENAVAVDVSLLTKGYQKGVYFLFFFDENNNIRRTYKTEWIE